jgi:hypothetical protein
MRHTFLIRITVAAAGVGALLTLATPLAAQTTLRDHLDPARMRPAGRDSFVVIMQPRGWQRLTMERAGSGWAVGDAITIEGMVTQGSTVTLDAALQEVSLRQEGKMMGRDMKIALDFAGGRVRGSATTPSSGPTGTIQIDTAMIAGLVDDNAVTPLLAAVRYRDSLDISFPVMASGKGTVSQQRIRVTGTETVTVPAGQFDTWKVELQADRSRVYAFVTRSAPYRIVKLSNGPAFEMHLLK